MGRVYFSRVPVASPVSLPSPFWPAMLRVRCEIRSCSISAAIENTIAIRGHRSEPTGPRHHFWPQIGPLAPRGPRWSPRTRDTGRQFLTVARGGGLGRRLGGSQRRFRYEGFNSERRLVPARPAALAASREHFGDCFARNCGAKAGLQQ